MNKVKSLAGNWATDFQASLVVFLVALPLGLGIAVASGLPPAAGILSSVIGGLVVGALSGAPLQVSGAAAGLVVVVYDIAATVGIAGLAAATMIAGFLQLISGFLGFGRLARRVSPSVVHGMLAGIGVLIVLSQVHVLMGGTSGSSAWANLTGIPATLASTGWFSANGQQMAVGGLGIACVLGLIFWPKIGGSFAKALPGAVIVTVLAAIVGTYFVGQAPTVQVPDHINDAWAWQGGNILRDIQSVEYWLYGLELALIASIESMLCASALSQLKPDAQVEYDRELSAQGVGNFLCGLVTALPITGVIVRSAANVQAGANTRMSTILHGFWALLALALLSSALATIPLTALAAILVTTGWRLFNPGRFMQLLKQDTRSFVIASATLLMVVFVDLLMGVIAGIALSAVWAFVASKLQLKPVAASASAKAQR